MDAKVVNILKDKVALEWKIFARYTSLNDVDAVNDQIDHDVDVDLVGHDDLTRGKFKIEIFLKKLYQQHPNDYRTCIQNSLKVMGRNDVLQDITLLEMCEALKKFYQTTYGKMDQLEHNVISTTNVELLNKFVELTVVDAYEVERDIVNTAEQELFLHRQAIYEPIEFYEVFSKELPLLLLCGIAGIGKTCLLRKCLLDWVSNTLWEKVDLVIYLECRKLNQYQNIVSINELLNVFYKNVFKECDVCEHFSMLFVIDGLDEFAYLDELINHSSLNPSNHPIVNVLADILDFHKYKCVVAGRVGAILQYKNKMTECRGKLVIQIMGFNDLGINEYVERVGNAKEAIKDVLNSSQIAKAMASVPFYLSAMCTVIGSSMLRASDSFFSTTELYCCIFLYFLQKHINRNNEPVYKLMEKESSKQLILKVCKVAWHLFNESKVVFSQKEMEVYFEDIGDIESNDLGFIEKVESQLGYQYQFVHLTLMEFCASLHAHINLSPEEILSNRKLRSCLPMICGLKNEKGGPFLKLFANLKTSKKESNSMFERNSLLHAVLDEPRNFFVYIATIKQNVDIREQKAAFLREPIYPFNDIRVVSKSINDRHVGDFDWFEKEITDDTREIFIKCFFEAQASITEDLKKSIDEQEWWIVIDYRTTAHEVSYEKYFMEKFSAAGCKLNELYVLKNILSEDEKKLVTLCSTNVRCVRLWRPVKIDGWTPTHKIEWLAINSYSIIDVTFVSINEFERFVLPWIRLAEELNLVLHDDTNFIDDICEWLRDLNFKRLVIFYRGKEFDNIEEFKVRNTKNV